MEEVLASPPVEDEETLDEWNPGIVIPISEIGFRRITADLLTGPELGKCHRKLDENPKHYGTNQTVQAHWDAIDKLYALGMSKAHPRLREWFPKEEQ